MEEIVIKYKSKTILRTKKKPCVTSEILEPMEGRNKTKSDSNTQKEIKRKNKDSKIELDEGEV